MIFPKHGDKVRIVLSSGVMKEGVVEFWAQDDEKGLTWTSLKPSTDSGETFMIQNYWVAGFLIIKENLAEKAKQIKIFEPILKETTDPDLRLKNLAELRKMQGESERQQVRKLLKRTDVGSAKEVQYSYPFKMKK